MFFFSLYNDFFLSIMFLSRCIHYFSNVLCKTSISSLLRCKQLFLFNEIFAPTKTKRRGSYLLSQPSPKMLRSCSLTQDQLWWLAIVNSEGGLTLMLSLWLRPQRKQSHQAFSPLFAEWLLNKEKAQPCNCSIQVLPPLPSPLLLQQQQLVLAFH